MFTKAGAEAYFNAEKAESQWLMVFGLLAIVLAITLVLVYKTVFFKGLSIPLVAIGLLQIAAGFTVYSRSDRQRMDIVYKIDMNPAALRDHEIPRMEKVIRSFRVYRYGEIALLAGGVVLFVLKIKQMPASFWAGLGLALALEAALMLVVDGVAEKGGQQYFDGIRVFSNGYPKGSH